MLPVPPPQSDNIDQSARDSAAIYGRDFAAELLVKAQIIAGNKRQRTTSIHVQTAWLRSRQEWQRPLWKDLVAGAGWALIGAFAPVLVESLRTGTDLSPLYVLVALVGAVMVIFGLRRPS
jgi:hypothetical protein